MRTFGRYKYRFENRRYKATDAIRYPHFVIPLISQLSKIEHPPLCFFVSNIISDLYIPGVVLGIIEFYFGEFFSVYILYMFQSDEYFRYFERSVLYYRIFLFL